MTDETIPKNLQQAKKFEVSGVRYLFAVCGFLGFCVIYAIRVNINVAIVAMVNNTAVYDKKNETSSFECKADPVPFSSNSSSSDEPQDGEFDWSPKMQGIVLGAFYYGYCISQIPGGRLAEIFSGKWVFGIGILITAILTLLTPLAARYHVGMLIAIRAIEGLAQGVTMPAMHAMLGRWMPDPEKSLLNALVYTGINIGTVTTMPLVGVLCNSTWFGGWPSAFYVIGIAGIFWFLFWCILVTDTPLNHPFISKEELKYITNNQTIDLQSQLPPIPWRKICTSIPFLSLILTQLGADWFFYTIINDLPTFFATVLHLKIEKNGLLSSLPYLLQTFVGITSALAADEVIRRGYFSTNTVRKFCNSAGSFGCAVGLVGVCFAGCNVTLNIVFFFLALALGGFSYSGYMLNHLDLSPEYAGTLMGISNTVSNLTGFLAPLVIGALTEEQQTLHQWRIAFSIAIIMIAVTTITFNLCSTTEKQNWISTDAREGLLNSVQEDSKPITSYGSMK